MPSLFDVNVLLAICHADHKHHGNAIQWLNDIETRAEIVICRVSQLGLLRLLNTPAVMLGQPRDVSGAWGDYDKLLFDQRFVFLNEPYQMDIIWRRMMPTRLISPKLWQDAYLAAFAMAAELQFVTFDRGFRQFTGLNLLILGDD